MTSLTEPLSDQLADDPLARARAERLELPDRALFWKWVWASVRPVVGWVLAGLGALALFLGWYGVSGQTLTAKQLPYLVSGGLTGIALIVLAGVFLATEDVRRQLGRLDRVEQQMAQLYALFVEDLANSELPASLPASRQTGEAVLALPNGTSYHRSGCALISGKPAAATVDASDIHRRALRPCRVCTPPSLD